MGALITRLLPLVVLGSGLYAIGQAASPTLTRTLDTVKTLLARSEMQSMAGAIQVAVDTGGTLPNFSNPVATAAFIRDHMTARFGRDPSKDLWDNPYRFVRVTGGVGVLSFGPNGDIDRGCGAEGGDVAGHSKRLQPRRRPPPAARPDVSTERPSQVPHDPQDHAADAENDDLCVVVTVNTERSPVRPVR